MSAGQESSAWVTLARAPALDACVLARALQFFEAPQDIIAASDASRAQAGMPPPARRFLSGPDAALRPAERAWLENPRHSVVPFTDLRYPAMLHSVPRRPIALFVAGKPDVLNDPQLAIVGSRNPTAQGRDTAASPSLADLP
jgi:DNA processing protein